MAISDYLNTVTPYEPETPPDTTISAWLQSTGRKDNVWNNWWFGKSGSWQNQYGSWKENQMNQYNSRLNAYDTNYELYWNSPANSLALQDSAGLNKYFNNLPSSGSASLPGHGSSQASFNAEARGMHIADLIQPTMSLVAGLQQLYSNNLDIQTKKTELEYLPEYLTNRNNNGFETFSGKNMANALTYLLLYGRMPGDVSVLGAQPGIYTNPSDSGLAVRGHAADVSTKEYNLSDYLPSVVDKNNYWTNHIAPLMKAGMELQNTINSLPAKKAELLVGHVQTIVDTMLKGLEYDKKKTEKLIEQIGFDNVNHYVGTIFNYASGIVNMVKPFSSSGSVPVQSPGYGFTPSFSYP